MTDKATHTPLPASDLLPISYRPDPMDDWGTIRAAPDADGVAWRLARISDPRVRDEGLWKFREAGTDPYEAVGKMFVHAVNSHHDLIEALRAVKAELQAAWEARTLPAECVSGETIRKINAALTKAEARHG